MLRAGASLVRGSLTFPALRFLAAAPTNELSGVIAPDSPVYRDHGRVNANCARTRLSAGRTTHIKHVCSRH